MPEQDCANQDIEIPDNAQVENRFVADIRDKEGELLWKEQYPAEVVERDKKVLGTYASAGQFQQRPTPRKGGLFKRADFEIVDAAPAAGNWLRGWDLAASTRSTSPYTASVKMKIVKGIVYIGAVDRFRVDESKLESSVVNIAKQDGRKTKISIPQDPGQAGKVQKASFAKALAGYDVSFSPESGDKELRATPFAAQVEAGNVKLVRGPWNDEYLDEASLFPRGFKDQIDATSRAYGELIKPRIRKVGASPQIVTN
jgi:predicted phage terminase large subunit-like protein